MVDARRLAWRALGALSVPWLAADRLCKPLRILGYHDVSDVLGFRQQLEYLVSRYRPLHLDEVMLVLGGEESVSRPLWVTFDDGDPSVIDVGMQVLDELNVPATLFICPGVIDSTTPFWWQVIDRAVELAISTSDGPVTPVTRAQLKSSSDAHRRELVRRVQAAIEQRTGVPFQRAQLATDQLRMWIDAGHSIGNHTWDHPTLDTCTPDEQGIQIERAHRWLADKVSPQHPVFAYPNGNHTHVAEKALSDLGYRVALLFDHRLARISDPLKLSRIRVNSGDDAATFRARVSGIHPAVHRLLRRS